MEEVKLSVKLTKSLKIHLIEERSGIRYKYNH
jgi:hypothetical protein